MESAHKFVETRLRAVEVYVCGSSFLGDRERINGLIQAIMGPDKYMIAHGVSPQIGPELEVRYVDTQPLIDALVPDGYLTDELGFAAASVHEWADGIVHELFRKASVLVSDQVAPSWSSPDGRASWKSPFDFIQPLADAWPDVEKLIPSGHVNWQVMGVKLRKEYARLVAMAGGRDSGKGGRPPRKIQAHELLTLIKHHQNEIKRQSAADELTGGDTQEYDNLNKAFKRHLDSGLIHIDP